ncbi:MAG: hypothetical protein II304_02725 [Bacteroidales bacterium]|nr:hypothetical protein [Bacteroidales bacterium]
MKKILLWLKILLFLLTLSFLALQCCAMDIKTFDTRDTYFQPKFVGYDLNKRLEYLNIKGVWQDPKKLSTRLMQEELFCSFSLMECMSGFAEIDMWGGKIVPPIYDVHFLVYKIIDYSSRKVKLYNVVTEYTIEIDLKNKTATKYKIFPNGDVNKYIMLFNCEKAAQYFKTIISDY